MVGQLKTLALAHGTSLVLVLGCLLIAIGVWMIDRSAGVIASGVLLILLAVLAEADRKTIR